MINLTHSRFGGFLLHRGRFRSGLLTRTRASLSTGCHAVSPRQDIHCADHIGVILIATLHTLELGLARAVLGGHIVTAGTREAGVVRGEPPLIVHPPSSVCIPTDGGTRTS